MGHLRLHRIPNSKRWQAVVGLLDAHAGAGEVIAASAEAIERDLSRGANDPGLVEAVRLLATLPDAARQDSFAAALRDLGLDIPGAPLLPDLATALGRALDREMAQRRARSDLGEIARNALVETLVEQVSPRLPGLFAADPADLRRAVAGLGGARFSDLARSFFARLTRDSLAYVLSRDLSRHIGAGRMFGSLAERTAFDAALDQHCREAARILKEFAPGWRGATLNRLGRIGRAEAAGFTAIALRKMVAELVRSRGGDG